MENRKVIVVNADDNKRTIYGAGDEYYYLATGKETNGQYFYMEAMVPPGAGPPPHIQTREEEAFYILEGELTFWADGEEVKASKGSFLNIPTGVKHYFRNLSDKSHT